MSSTVISSSLSTGNKNFTTDKKIPGDPNRDWHRPFHKRGEVRIQEVGTHFNVKFVEDPPSVLSLRPCDYLVYS